MYVQNSYEEELQSPQKKTKKENKQAAHSPEELMLSIIDESRTIQMP